MKKVALVIILGLVLLSIGSYANVEIDNSSRYGYALQYQTFGDYKGTISIDGLYVCEEGSNYIFKILYSNGELATANYSNRNILKTSFFNPPAGSIIKVNGRDTPDRIYMDDNSVWYLIDKDLFSQVEFITIFLDDVVYTDNSGDNIMMSFRTNQLNNAVIPARNSLFNDYRQESEEIKIEFNDAPSTWAQNSIEELKYEDIFRDSAFMNFKQSVTRDRFVYLMVELFEYLTGDKIDINPDISFSDSEDLYVLKAASVGITSGVGNGLFGPKLTIDREQMTTFIVRTLSLVGINLESNDDYNLFSDDEQISSWARDSIYASKNAGIIKGIGENMFSPKAPANNEQALFITRDLLSRYGDLSWFKEFSGDRVYLDYEDKLYKINFDDNIIMDKNVENNSMYFKNFEDIETFLNIAFLKTNDLDYVKSSNPNIMGGLVVHDYEIMKIFGEIIYSGVDRIGEKTIVEINENTYSAEITTYDSTQKSSLKNFITVNYYDIDDSKMSLETLPTNSIFELLGKDFIIEYRSDWDIYIIKFLN